MSRDHRRNGAMMLRFATAAGLATVTLAVAAPAVAQDDAIERCRTAETDAERIACLEEALRTEPAAPPAPPPAATPATTPSPEPAERGGFLRMPRLPFVGRDESPQPESPVIASQSPEAEEMGSEQLARARGELFASQAAAPRMVASVVAFEEVPYKRLQVELDNGQVWRQSSSDPAWNRVRYGDPEEVELFESGFGGYRMKLIGTHLTLPVERVQ